MQHLFLCQRKVWHNLSGHPVCKMRNQEMLVKRKCQPPISSQSAVWEKNLLFALFKQQASIRTFRVHIRVISHWTTHYKIQVSPSPLNPLTSELEEGGALYWAVERGFCCHGRSDQRSMAK